MAAGLSIAMFLPTDVRQQFNRSQIVISVGVVTIPTEPV